MWVSKRRSEGQEDPWINTAEIVISRSPPFYQRLRRLVDERGLDRFVEDRRRAFHAHTREHRSISQGGTCTYCGSPQPVTPLLSSLRSSVRC